MALTLQLTEMIGMVDQQPVIGYGPRELRDIAGLEKPKMCLQRPDPLAKAEPLPVSRRVGPLELRKVIIAAPEKSDSHLELIRSACSVADRGEPIECRDLTAVCSYRSDTSGAALFLLVSDSQNR